MSSDDDDSRYGLEQFQRMMMMQHLMQARESSEREVKIQGSEESSGALEAHAIRSLIEDAPFSDHALRFGTLEDRLLVHRLILAQGSPYFKTALAFKAATSGQDAFSCLDPDLPVDLVVRCVGFLYASCGVIALPEASSAARDLICSARDYVDKGTLEVVIQLFEVSSFMNAYKIASQWQVKKLQAALIYLLTPDEYTRRHQRGSERATEVISKCRATISLTTCYDFYEAFCTDEGFDEFKKCVDIALLNGLSKLKHVQVDGSNHHSGDHSCSAVLPLDTIPFQQLELALKSIVNTLTETLQNVSSFISRSDGMSMNEVTKLVLSQELSDMLGETKVLETERRFNKQQRSNGVLDLEMYNTAQREINRRANRLSDEMRKLDRVKQNIEASDEGNASPGAHFWKKLQRTTDHELRSNVIDKEAACVLLDLFCGHFGAFQNIPIKYIALVILGMDEKHLSQRIFPMMIQSPHPLIDQTFWMTLMLLRTSSRAVLY